MCSISLIPEEYFGSHKTYMYSNHMTIPKHSPIHISTKTHPSFETGNFFEIWISCFVRKGYIPGVFCKAYKYNNHLQSIPLMDMYQNTTKFSKRYCSKYALTGLLYDSHVQ